jgi:hypothetical protein
MRPRTATLALLAAGLATSAFAPPTALATEGAWKRTISNQDRQDLFYNYYVGPGCSCGGCSPGGGGAAGGTAAAMYPSPLPVPPHVGWTYTTYQPFMPHEYMYHHKMTHYAWNPGAGWSRAKVRYGTYGLRLDDIFYNLSDKY